MKINEKGKVLQRKTLKAENVLSGSSKRYSFELHNDTNPINLLIIFNG